MFAIRSAAAGRDIQNGYVPRSRSLATLRKAAAGCQACPLFEHATQTVFGAGAKHARLMFIGEQPGDQEDLCGKPFVGPAGQLLDELLAEVGIDRADVFVTNAVKHFKWTPRGKRRLHAKPNAREVAACRPWLQAEIEAVHPVAIVCLGATAAQAMLGSKFRVTTQRGKILAYHGDQPSGLQTSGPQPTRWIVGTYHPSAVLRSPDRERRRKMRAELAADLTRIARRVAAIQ